MEIYDLAPDFGWIDFNSFEDLSDLKGKFLIIRIANTYYESFYNANSLKWILKVKIYGYPYEHIVANDKMLNLDDLVKRQYFIYKQNYDYKAIYIPCSCMCRNL